MQETMFLKTTILMSLLLAGGSATAECRAIGAGPVAVVELYTSEGCNSCPPADRWLSGLGRSAAPLRIVPLALHVPYWDYIGWQDRFASPRFEERQRRAARQSGSGVVYTPQVMVNGRDFRGWNTDRFDAALKTLAAQPASASLTLAITPGREAILTGQGPPGASTILALVEDGLSNQVRAGENAGRRLEHDHVVRDWLELGAVGADGRIDLRHSLAALPGVRTERSSLVALLQDPVSGRILQAVALPWCAS